MKVVKGESKVPPEYVTKRGASEWSGLGVDYLEKCLKNGWIPYVRLPSGKDGKIKHNGTVLIRLTDLEAFIRGYGQEYPGLHGSGNTIPSRRSA